MRTLPILMFSAALLPVVPAPAPPGILDAEWAFIRHCERAGISASFLEAFHPEGLIFRPQPVNGREWYGRQPDSKSRLAWFPAVSFTAASDEVGYNAGPWTWRPEAGAEPAAQGWFFSVWKRDGKGTWKLFWDIGLPTREAAAGMPALKGQAPAANAHAPGAALSDAQALDLDRQFIARAGSLGLETAYRTQLAPEGRVFRSPAQPATGWEAVRTLLAGSPGARTWEPRGAVVARSGEILFVQGGYSRLRDGRPAETGSYVRVWRRLGPTWTLELDLESPRPPDREK